MKKLVLMSACVVIAMMAKAQQKVADNRLETWAESIATAKEQAYQELKETCLPVVSKVIKAKTAATPFSADVTGLDEIVLYTWGTVDGNSDDQAVWANAKLTNFFSYVGFSFCFN